MALSDGTRARLELIEAQLKFTLAIVRELRAELDVESAPAIEKLACGHLVADGIDITAHDGPATRMCRACGTVTSPT